MQTPNFVIPTTTLMLIAAFTCAQASFAQGFSNYAAPQTKATKVTAAGAGESKQVAKPKVAEQARAQENVQGQTPTLPAKNSATQTQGGYLAEKEATSAIVNPPAEYSPSKEELANLDEFLTRWEQLGKNIKRVSCNVHIREFDSVLQQNAKRPVAHTWGEFKFVTPNKLSYHVKGEFEYSDQNPEGEWKEHQNEWKFVLDGKSIVQYDFKNQKAVVRLIPEEEQNLDLTMDNGQFPLFFVAKADVLKSRFYLQFVTPPGKQKSEVWITAYPRYARDAQQFKSITVLLRLKDLQPTYMRKISTNGKSRTDITFEKIAINEGKWTIEGTVEQGWQKEVLEEQFSILRQQPVVMENGTAVTLVSDPKQIPSSKKTPSAQNGGKSERTPRGTTTAQPSKSSKKI